MKPMDWLRSLDRLQQSLGFKIVASSAILLVAVGLLIAYAVDSAKRAEELRVSESIADIRRDANIPEPATPDGAKSAAEGASGGQTGAAIKDATADEAAKAFVEKLAAERRFINDLVSRQTSLAGFAGIVGTTTAIALAVVWLGLGLTYLALASLAAGVAWPMLAFGSPGVQTVGVFTAGAIALASSFAALIRLLGAALSPASPTLAVARNVVSEAVRMNISLVFIVALIAVLALLPTLLDPNTPLRYRVQAFLQYSSAGTFFLAALLVLFLSCATVAFEQRDKIIWQTMTKPISAWQFVLGKWLGVVGVAGVLMAVCSSGIFLFTEYLRRQPAQGEVAAFVPREQGQVVTEDRAALEYQILAGRTATGPTIDAATEELIGQEIRTRYERALKEHEEAVDGSVPAPDLRKITKDVEAEKLAAFFAIPRLEWRTYTFEGLEDARALGRPLTFRYRVNAGGNMPTDLYRVSFYIPGSMPIVREVHLAQTITQPISHSVIAEDGKLTMQIGNGDVERQQGNPETISFPPDGLEISYVVSSFHGNFVRVALIMLLKLAFLAMIGVCASTFLAFPVACLVAFGVFMCAESASFLLSSLENFRIQDHEGHVIWWAWAVDILATQIGRIFRFYSELSPTGKLVQGMLVPWSLVGQAVAVLGALTAVLGITGGVIFRNRELAIYSGH